jgi:hypothetical protein
MTKPAKNTICLWYDRDAEVGNVASSRHSVTSFRPEFPDEN